jgi:hypothetical protein
VSSRASFAARLLAVLLIAAVLPAIERVAAADPVSSCTPSAGVIVAVDFGHWGGAVQRGCDANPTTGLAALQHAGFTVTGTTKYGLAFVCRINGYPTQADDSCVNTPPPTAYWSYWNAGPGQDGWSYNSQGAMSYHPPPGSVDAWAFGAGNQPSFRPAAVRAVRPPASSSPPRSLPPGPFSTPSANGSAVDAASSAVVAARTAGSAGTTAKAPAVRTSSAVVSRPGSAVARATPTPSGSGPQVIDAAPVVQHPAAASRSLLPVLLTLAVVVLLGGGAGWAGWQRRRRAG